MIVTIILGIHSYCSALPREAPSTCIPKGQKAKELQQQNNYHFRIPVLSLLSLLPSPSLL